MGAKEWGKFGKQVMKYLEELQATDLYRVADLRKMLLVVGYPGTDLEILRA